MSVAVIQEGRASDRAYATLLSEIQHGELAPGTTLGEVEQATRLGVSRTPLREAIRKLIADGLVTQLSPRVIAVTEFDIDDIRKLFDARRALEETCARIAAGRADGVLFAELANAFAVTTPVDEQSIDEYYALIQRFDAALDAAVDNPYLTSSLRMIRTHLVRARRLARDNQDRLVASATEHRLIASAIAQGNAELAAHATHIHLHNALESILDSLSEGHS